MIDPIIRRLLRVPAGRAFQHDKMLTGFQMTDDRIAWQWRLIKVDSELPANDLSALTGGQSDVVRVRPFAARVPMLQATINRNDLWDARDQQEQAAQR